jgi:hypothetical protein
MMKQSSITDRYTYCLLKKEADILYFYCLTKKSLIVGEDVRFYYSETVRLRRGAMGFPCFWLGKWDFKH